LLVCIARLQRDAPAADAPAGLLYGDGISVQADHFRLEY
jgi:hypothetical protein